MPHWTTNAVWGCWYRGGEPMLWGGVVLGSQCCFGVLVPWQGTSDTRYCHDRVLLQGASAGTGTLCILGSQCNFRELVPLWGASATSLSTYLLNLWAPCSRRSAYCAASVASLTNILTPTLFAGTAEWIAR